MKLEFLLKDKYDEGRTAGEAEGISIGRAEGEANATSRIVKEMNANGIPVQVIAKCVSLDIREVQRVIDSK